MINMNSMQAACWLGRSSHAPLGQVAAHLYAEFETPGLTAEILQAALDKLCARHDMLRLHIDTHQMLNLHGAGSPLPLEVEDLSALDAAAQGQRLQEKRLSWSHQKLDLTKGQVARFGLTVLSPGRARLHVDTDMIAIDPSSFRILINDLARLCQDPESDLPAVPSYADYRTHLDQDPARAKAARADRDWWRARLADIPPALPLPERPPAPPQSDRLSAWLDSDTRDRLFALASTHEISRAALFLGCFALALRDVTGCNTYRVTVPSFVRTPFATAKQGPADVDGIVGEFANVLLLAVDHPHDDSPAALCQRLAQRLLEALAHAQYSGVDLLRDLSRHHGSAQVSPVVFTAALDLPGGELFDPVVKPVLGEMCWVMSQGPQVALDAQAAAYDDGVLLNWDLRLDALERDWAAQVFDRYLGYLHQFAQSPEVFEAPLFPAERDARPLTTLQQSYLLGRQTGLPLGGVAMQEFRAYRGHFAPEVLHARVAALAAQHDCLRTSIDMTCLVQRVRPLRALPFTHIDLTALSRAEALQHIADQQEAYAHDMCDPEQALWDVTVFSLPLRDADEGDLVSEPQVVFVRVDAMIADGNSIAALLHQLFEGTPGKDLTSVRRVSGRPYDRASDAQYWRQKLGHITDPLDLPWQRPLENILQSRYARQMVTLPAQTLQTLAQSGAKHGLFLNALLTTVIAHVLSHWCGADRMCLGLPVAPDREALTNRSAFVAIEWMCHAEPGAEDDDLLARGQRLQRDILQGLQHLGFAGVDLSRMLYEQMGRGPALPVVITNGLDWPVLNNDAPMRQVDGLTQTPQVAMDIRLTKTPEAGLQVAIDFAKHALDPSLVDTILRAIKAALIHVADTGALVIPQDKIIGTAPFRYNSPESAARKGSFLCQIAEQLFNPPACPQTPRTALVQGDTRLSYAELGRRVAAAQRGLAQRGVMAGDVVALALPRSFDHTACVLACALGGVVWVPIDADAPPDRRMYLLENCAADLVITNTPQDGLACLHPADLYREDGALPLNDLTELSRSDAPALYLYTSGTTGLPKGVVLCNRAISNVIEATCSRWDLSSCDVTLSVTPLHHDMSVFDVFGTLAAGGTLVLPTAAEEKDAIAWNRLVQHHGVTLWCSVPSIVEMLLSCRAGTELQSLRLVAQGGDYIKPAVIAELRSLLPQARLISLGGPTETTIWSIWHDISDEDTGAIPYGVPLPGNAYYLLDEAGRPCPVGKVGRIYTAGVNLALGYLVNGALDQTDFITIADETGTPRRAFRTGDCGRYRSDGVLLFDSRVGGYIKVRGVRVSLPDVENALTSCPGLRQAMAVDYGETRAGDTNIALLYVSGPGQSLRAADLRRYARQHLPQSHIPARFIEVEAIPLTANAKPDRRAARALVIGAGMSPPVSPSAPQEPRPHRLPTGTDLTADQILQICLSVLHQDGRDAHRSPACNGDTPLWDLGLSARHLQPVAQHLAEHTGRPLDPRALVPCRTAQEVAQLLHMI